MDSSIVERGLFLLEMTEALSYSEYKNNVKEMERLEYNLIRRCKACDKKHSKDLEKRKSEIDANKLKEKLDSDFYNPALLKELLCITESTSYYPEFDIGNQMMNEKIRSYFTNLEQIGAKSGEGVAMSSSFLDVKKVFVVKTNKPGNESSLLHELVIGVYGTNKLRDHIPNFSYIFGGFKCSPPSIDEKGQVDSFCLNNNEAVNYVLYEFIDNAVSLKEYIKNCTGKQFLSCYLQVVMALKLAKEKIDYSHYDLHTENIMMRKVPKYGSKYQIGYPTGLDTNKEIYVTTDIVPTFIDYGFSHIKHDGIDYGRVGFEVLSIFSDKSWIFHDLYKLLLFSTDDAINSGNIEVLEVCRKIFLFFNTKDNLDVVTKNQITKYFSFPLFNETEKLTVEDYFDFIIKQFNPSELDFISEQLNSSIPILSCQSFCETSKEILTSIGVIDEFLINDISDFYYLYVNNEKDRETLKEHLNYNKAMEAQKKKVKKLYERLEIMILNYNVRDTYVIQDVNNFSKIKEKFDNVILILDLIDRASYNTRAGEFAASLFDGKEDDVVHFIKLSEDLLLNTQRKMILIYEYIGNLRFEIKELVKNGLYFKDNYIQNWYSKGVDTLSKVYGI